MLKTRVPRLMNSASWKGLGLDFSALGVRVLGGWRLGFRFRVLRFSVQGPVSSIWIWGWFRQRSCTSKVSNTIPHTIKIICSLLRPISKNSILNISSGLYYYTNSKQFLRTVQSLLLLFQIRCTRPGRHVLCKATPPNGS